VRRSRRGRLTGGTHCRLRAARYGRPVRIRAAAVLVAAAVVGCGGDDASPDRQPATTGTTIEASISTSTTVGARSDEGIGALETTLGDLLVTAGELGDPALADLGYAPDDGAPPCGVDAGSLAGETALVGTRIGADGRQVLEELRAYADPNAAAGAVAALRAGPACAGARDITAEVGADQAFAVSIGGAGDVVVVAQVADVVATFRIEGFAAPVEIAAFGLGKVLAFLEQGSG
jgi:hypothetical protein